MQSESFIEEEMIGANEGVEKYLFVCSGNTCRSPMAAAVFNTMNRSCGKVADSCGLSFYSGMSCEMSEGARQALEGCGIYGISHRSKMVDEQLMEQADLVIGMTAEHMEKLLTFFPEYAKKITSMPEDIEDPAGGDDLVYKICLQQICDGLNVGFDRVCDEEESEL